jgi:hypothetical protein
MRLLFAKLLALVSILLILLLAILFAWMQNA